MIWRRRWAPWGWGIPSVSWRLTIQGCPHVQGCMPRSFCTGPLWWWLRKVPRLQQAPGWALRSHQRPVMKLFTAIIPSCSSSGTTSPTVPSSLANFPLLRPVTGLAENQCWSINRTMVVAHSLKKFDFLACISIQPSKCMI